MYLSLGRWGKDLNHISGIMGMSFEILDIVINCLKENFWALVPKTVTTIRKIREKQEQTDTKQ